MPEKKIDLRRMAERCEDAPKPMFCLFAIKQAPYTKVLLEEELYRVKDVATAIEVWRGAYPPHEGWNFVKKDYAEGQAWLELNFS